MIARGSSKSGEERDSEICKLLGLIGGERFASPILTNSRLPENYLFLLVKTGKGPIKVDAPKFVKQISQTMDGVLKASHHSSRSFSVTLARVTVLDQTRGQSF
ncbi:hypothetical protein Tco_0653038 [Tanacetum coccineum]|uniref:Uncharacterized protein n=1 Tax=Tanacetum coccineum TaxID=301880 RepID=A0ABQ4WZD8_9ASTR